MTNEIIFEALDKVKQHWLLLAINGWPLAIIMSIQQWEGLRLQDSGDQFSSTLILALIALTIFGTAFMIFSIRLGLHGPPPGKRFALEFKRTELMYVLLSILIGVGVAVVFLIAVIPVGLVSLTGVGALMMPVGVLMMGAAVGIVFWGLLRLALIFVALTEELESPARASWALTQGHFWTVFFVYLWSVLAFGLLMLVLSVPAGALAAFSIEASMVFFIPFLIINILATPYFAFIATGMYRRFNSDAPMDDSAETS